MHAVLDQACYTERLAEVLSEIRDYLISQQASDDLIADANERIRCAMNASQDPAPQLEPYIASKGYHLSTSMWNWLTRLLDMRTTNTVSRWVKDISNLLLSAHINEQLAGLLTTSAQNAARNDLFTYHQLTELMRQVSHHWPRSLDWRKVQAACNFNAVFGHDQIAQNMFWHYADRPDDPPVCQLEIPTHGVKIDITAVTALQKLFSTMCSHAIQCPRISLHGSHVVQIIDPSGHAAQVHLRFDGNRFFIVGTVD